MIRSATPPETTEIISYGLPTFRYKGMLVSYGAFANHCSLFALNGSALGELKNELRAYSTSKGTIRFPADQPPPAALVKKLVKARVAQIEKRKKP
jgi:uncharacterized protein YdhG (YjbR/CyaY superfamily)